MGTRTIISTITSALKDHLAAEHNHYYPRSGKKSC